MSWTDEEDEKLEQLFKEGKTISEISQTLQRNPGGILSRLSKHGWGIEYK